MAQAAWVEGGRMNYYAPFETLSKCHLLSPRIRQIWTEKIKPMVYQGQKVIIFCKPKDMGVVGAMQCPWYTKKFVIAHLDGDFDPPVYIFISEMNQRVADLINPNEVEVSDWGGQTLTLICAYTPDLVREMKQLAWEEVCPRCWSLFPPNM